jgi:hypothetical protein
VFSPRALAVTAEPPTRTAVTPKVFDSRPRNIWNINPLTSISILPV